MIQVEHLTKRYGDFTAVNDLSFEIGEGSVYGFLGPNGAGKSTTMNIMTGCLSATDGKVMIDGHDIYEDPIKTKKLIGYLPEIPPLYTNETPLEYLTFVGEAKGLRGAELKKQIADVMELAGITEMKNRLISALSKGYKQRVGIAQALLGNPEVIILDEPTVGLDPIQIIEIRDLIRKLGETHTVIFSSHILSEVQAICGKVLIISKGNLVAFDTPENLEKLFIQTTTITVRAQATKDEALEVLRAEENLTGWECTAEDDGTVRIEVHTEAEDVKAVSKAVATAFAKAGIPIFEITSKKANLEDIFIELTESEQEIDEKSAETGKSLEKFKTSKDAKEETEE